MKPIDIFSSLTDIDEEYIADASSKHDKKHKLMLSAGVTAALVAVALPLLLISTGNNGLKNNVIVSSTETDRGNSSQEASMIYEIYEETQTDCYIYYVKDHKLQKKEITVSIADDGFYNEVYSVWRELNGIPEEVRLLGVTDETQGSESTGNGDANYTISKPSLRVRVTRNLKDFCNESNEQLLLSSLKKTIGNVLYDTQAECEIIFE